MIAFFIEMVKNTLYGKIQWVRKLLFLDIQQLIGV